MRKRLHGVIALLVTPFHDDFSLNEEALRAEIDWCFGHGATGIVATPSIGEFIHLSDEERVRCYEITLERAAKHRDAITAAVTSGPDTRVAQRFTLLARKMGFDNAMVIPPFYWRCGYEEVFRHYQMIAETCDMPITLYHNPELSKFHMSPEFMGRVTSLEQVVAVKEVETDLQHLEGMVQAIRGKADYLQTYRAYYTGRQLGSVGGFINVSAVPACVAMDRALAKGDRALAQEIQIRLNNCFPRGGEGALGHLGTTKVTASVVTGIEMGPARPPYMAPPNAKELIRSRLPLLEEVIRA
ncbi:MAG TPA: dihydrodipicolinate synthase family protein [Candidatus Acidoferrales bacterium]|nr:dihydrodipicolinate synthase family protein [Candidatus Acidoferrales bacterium]